jgi:Protein of unknown function (DUF4199)
MKTCSLYGFILALAGALLTLALYFLGFHSDPAKLTAAKWIGGLGGLAIGITFTVLGVRARRAEVPESEEFGYGRALGAGVLLSLVSSFLSAVFAYAYNAFINPGFTEIMLQDAMDKAQAKGVSGAQLDQVEKFTRLMMGPGAQGVTTLIFGFIFGFIISLVVAAFLKRAAPAGPPKV